ncbi:efflux RND transporter periplasmic adaptor subunit [Polaribacter undariae]|uniref:Efflux RND transporter periplasmic adaptor subunit n=1 Tax=Polaribacter sejongensis TaxID=985043 RepID=A0AAJ1QUC4_9FLAO|nr:efflux RND transporter periplasmic adaptor subunit [Polaribacter undariae]MDN3618172.1 efflux RND transporter periplasmic adaptor subunit [Polaribacter undariae]UWD30839.1 efflux RND transporter periplasmic adaptor subunit [Polaribacter undariae]
MKHYKLLSLLSLGVFLVVASCTNKEQPAAAAAQGPAPSFPVVTMQPKTVTSFNEYPTSLEGVVNSAVRAKVSGYIQKVMVDEGQKVRKGQVLFKLETQSLSQDASAAKASVNVAQVEVNKLIPLVEKNIISSVQLETAKANLAQAKANYSSVSASIAYGTIRSQVDGHVGAINYREGALVSPADPTPLTTVSDISKVYAFFSLNESEYLDFLQNAEGKNLEEKLANYAEINLVLANGSMYAEKGKIETSTGQVNKNTGTVSLRAVFNNPNQLLTNGNSGKIQIPTVFENAIVVPQQATYEQQGNIMLFKVGEGNKAETSIIKVKAAVGNLYVVESGINLKNKIVVSGVGKLRSGTVITPQDTPFDDAIKPVETLFKN